LELASHTDKPEVIQQTQIRGIFTSGWPVIIGEAEVISRSGVVRNNSCLVA